MDSIFARWCKIRSTCVEMVISPPAKFEVQTILQKNSVQTPPTAAEKVGIFH